jgi:hypothetical protein
MLALSLAREPLGRVLNVISPPSSHSISAPGTRTRAPPETLMVKSSLLKEVRVSPVALLRLYSLSSWLPLLRVERLLATAPRLLAFRSVSAVSGICEAPPTAS